MKITYKLGGVSGTAIFYDTPEHKEKLNGWYGSPEKTAKIEAEQLTK